MMPIPLETSAPHADDIPCIFLVIPFEPKMNSKAGFDAVVNSAICKKEGDLLKAYKAALAEPIIKKLHRLLAGIDHQSHHKSLAIMVSPLVEKVYFFDYITVEWSRFHAA